MTLRVFGSDKTHQLFISIFMLLICGAIALPMLPVWQGAVRLLAGLILIQLLSKFKKPVLIVLVSLSLIALTGWLNNLLMHPFDHIIHSLIDVYGQMINKTTDLALLLYDIICLFALAIILLKYFWQDNRISAFFIFSLILFWSGALLHPVLVLLSDPVSNEIGQMLTGTSMWASWLYWSFIAIILVRNRTDIEIILKGAGLGIIIIALIVAVQWITNDYSYVIDSPDFEQYFYRVRGTYYYHTAVTFVLAMGVAVLLSLFNVKERNAWWILIGILLLFFLVYVNNTRAMSLALLAGLTIIAVFSLKNKHYLLLFLSVLGCFISLQNITYLKPTRIIHSDHAKEITQQKKPKVEKIQSLVSANSSRSQLAFQGISIIPEFFWTGSGVGTLDLPLPGNSFNGIITTYSSHSLYLDVLLMAGIFSFLGFFLVFSIALWRSLLNGFTDDLRENNILYIGLSGVLIIFLSGSFFLPQERNETIGMAFLFASLAIIRPEGSIYKNVESWSSFQTVSIVLITASAFFWSLLTSPSYIFPAIEFAARYADKPDEQVYVNEPKMKPVLELFLRLSGKSTVHVQVLKDNPDLLPESGAWIIWNPGQDKKYPLLRETLGYQKNLRDGHEPSLVLKNNWWVVRSSQPVDSFIFVGSRDQIAIPLNEIAKVVSKNNIELIETDKNGKPLPYKIKSGNVRLNLLFNTKLPPPDFIKITKARNKEAKFKDITIDLSEVEFINNEYIIKPNGLLPDSVVFFEAYLRSYPNNAYYAKIMLQPGKNSGQKIADKNYGSGVLLGTKNINSVLFDFSNQDIPPIGIYRMVAMHYRGRKNRQFYSWDVLASYNNFDWFKLETRQNIRLSQDPEFPSSFVLNNREKYTFYKFRFFPASAKGEESGIMELELYPVP